MATQDPTIASLTNELLNFKGYRQGTLRRLSANQLTSKWLAQHGTVRPIFIPSTDNITVLLGMQPDYATPVTYTLLEHTLGPTHKVETLDIATQTKGPSMTLRDWTQYWSVQEGTLTQADIELNGFGRGGAGEDEGDSGGGIVRKRGAAKTAKKVLELKPVSVVVDDVGQQLFQAPTAVREVDLVTALNALNGSTGNATATTTTATTTQLPKQQVCISMAPKNAFTDFTLPPGGASTWIHLFQGKKTMALIPPTTRNLTSYAKWALHTHHESLLLHSCEGAAVAELTPGDTLILPPGWLYASVAVQPCIVASGHFLRQDSLAMHLEIARLEDHLKVDMADRYSGLKALMWGLVKYTVTLLHSQKKLDDGELEKRAAERGGSGGVVEQEKKLRAEENVRTKQRDVHFQRKEREMEELYGAGGADLGGGQAKRKRNDDFVDSDDDNWGVSDESNEDDWEPTKAATARGAHKTDGDDDTGSSDIDEFNSGDCDISEDADDDYGINKPRKPAGGAARPRRTTARQAKMYTAKVGGGGGDDGDDFDFDFDDDDEDEEEYYGSGGSGKFKRSAQATAAPVGGGGTRTSTRVRSGSGRTTRKGLAPEIAAALINEDDIDGGFGGDVLSPQPSFNFKDDESGGGGGMDQGQEEYYKQQQQKQPTAVKLKVKLGAAAPQAAVAFDAAPITQEPPPPVATAAPVAKFKIKLGGAAGSSQQQPPPQKDDDTKQQQQIPQVDGLFDDGSDDDDDYEPISNPTTKPPHTITAPPPSTTITTTTTAQQQATATIKTALDIMNLIEEDNQGLAALVSTLRRWLCSPPNSNSNNNNTPPASIPNPRQLLLLLEVLLKNVGYDLEPPAALVDYKQLHPPLTVEERGFRGGGGGAVRQQRPPQHNTGGAGRPRPVNGGGNRQYQQQVGNSGGDRSGRPLSAIGRSPSVVGDSVVVEESTGPKKKSTEGKANAAVAKKPKPVNVKKSLMKKLKL